jgi:uncharacterized protein YukE
MSQIIVSPSEMRAFSRQLADVLQRMKAEELKIKSEIEELSATWRDQKYRAFNASWKDLCSQMRTFYSASERYLVFLDHKARAADRYLNG